MRTTIDIPDAIYPAIATASEACGLSVEEYILRQVTLPGANGELKTPADTAQIEPRALLQSDPEKWFESLPDVDPAAVDEVQRIIDEEYSKIDPKDWE